MNFKPSRPSHELEHGPSHGRRALANVYQTGSSERGRAWREQKGITGLETAIVLIAFVVVSSVFAFAALSTGLFSSDQAKETIQAGLDEAQGTLDLQGSAIANATTSAITAEAVGTGDASTVAFNLDNGPIVPGTIAVYLAGVVQTEGTAYTVTQDASPSVVTFTSAPGSSVAITADYTGYSVNSVVLQLANAAGGKGVDLTPGETILTYRDADNLSSAITDFGLSWLGTNDADNRGGLVCLNSAARFDKWNRAAVR